MKLYWDKQYFAPDWKGKIINIYIATRLSESQILDLMHINISILSDTNYTDHHEESLSFYFKFPSKEYLNNPFAPIFFLSIKERT